MTDIVQIPGIDKDVAEILSSCSQSTERLAKVFMPDNFSRVFDDPYKELFAALDDDTKQKVVILAPRGVGKTSIVSGPFLARNILFQLHKHIVYVSATNTHAIEKTENLKLELLSNQYFTPLFGNVQSDQFAKDCWITASGIKVVPRGAGQQVRGSLFQHYRPSLIVVDDLEDSKHVLSEEQRRDQWEWFNTDLLNSVDRNSDKWRIVVIGTLLHEDSVLAKLVRDPDWTVVKLRIWDNEHKTLFPNFMMTEQVQKLYDSFCRNNLADAFAREYCNDPVSRDAGKFRQSYFKYYSEADLVGRELDTVILIDPAKTISARADYTAIVGVSIDQRKSAIYVRDIVNERLHPEETFQRAAEMGARLHTRVYGFETTSLHEYATKPFEDYMRSNRRQYELVELPARAKKEHRIAALIPYYRQGNVYHNDSGVCNILEDQLLSFDRSQFDDVMDALAYIVIMMDVGGRFFCANYNEDDEKKALQILEDEDIGIANFDDWQLV